MGWLFQKNNQYFTIIFSVLLLFFCTTKSYAQSITSISPTSGNIGTTITITGTGFNPFAANDVYFGPVKVTVNANASGNLITVNVPAGASSYTPIIVRNITTGLQASSLSSSTPYFNITHSPALTITPASYNLSADLPGSSSQAIASGDFDNDGYADIATGSGIVGSFATILVYENNGLGDFPTSFPRLSLSGTSSAAFLKTADIDGDGNLDIVAAKSTAGDLDLFKGNGDGTFLSFPSIAGVTGSGAGVALEDINNDGFIDILTAGGGSLNILIGNGTGDFIHATGSPKSLSPIFNSRNISTPDVNNDGFLDIVIPSGFGANSVLVLLNNQDNTFANTLLYPIGNSPFNAISGDYDGDGNMDIAALSLDGDNITILQGDGLGGFVPFPASPIAIPVGDSYGLEQGDFDGDGNIDLVVGGYTTNQVPLLKGDGAGGFASFPSFPFNVGPSRPFHIISGDFNNDGITDITFANWGANKFRILLSPQSFRTTWVTTDGQITIPTTGTGYNYDIIWANLTNTGVGNGAITGVNGNYTISGLTNGDTYQVLIRGDFPRIYFNNGTEKDKIQTVEEWGNIAWTSFANAFYGCSAFNITATDVPNLSGVTDLSGMFRLATSFNSSINTWSFSGITDMNNMFNGASLYNQSVSSWDVSNVTDMTSMLDNSGYSTTNYDATLEAWDALTLQSGVTLGAVGVIYCSTSAVVARADLISTFSWTINDGGVCEPTTQATNISFSNISTTQTDINWVNGDGSNRMVVVKAGSMVDADPSDLTTYTANTLLGSGTQIGAGNYVVYNGTAATVTLTGLTTGVTYHVRVYEYNGTTGNENYSILTAVNNPSSFTTIAPEINLFSGPTNTSPVLTNAQVTAVDFGSATQPNNITQTFAIENTGTSDLTISSITASGTDFSVASAITTVAVGATQTFTVTLSGMSTGTFNAAVTIASDDIDESTFTFPITGEITIVLDPNIQIELESSVVNGTVEYGSTEEGADLILTFDILNNGIADLNVSSISSSNSTFSVSSSPFPATIIPASSLPFSVTFMADQVGQFESTIIVSSNDPDEPNFPFIVRGSVKGAVVVITNPDNSVNRVIIANDDIDIGQTPLNIDIEKMFGIENLSDSEAIIINSITVDNPVFEVVDIPTTILANGFEPFIIKLLADNIGIYSGVVRVSTSINRVSFSVTGEVLATESPNLNIYNIVTPNGDGVHDFFHIGNISSYKKNRVTIFNRWGDIVFEVSGYDNQSKIFEGVANRATNKELDTGNYYYSIDKGNGEKPATGFLFIKR